MLIGCPHSGGWSHNHVHVHGIRRSYKMHTKTGHKDGREAGGGYDQDTLYENCQRSKQSISNLKIHCNEMKIAF